MVNAWIITRHLDDAIASSINVDDLIIDQDARTYEIMKVKAGLEKLGVNTKLMRLIGDIGSSKNVIDMKESLPDLAIIRCTLWGWDLAIEENKILEELEKQGVTLINSSQTHLVCHDKFLQYKKLCYDNIRVPKTMNIDFNMKFEFILSEIEWGIGYPVVIKPRFGSAGVLAVKCNNADELKAAYENISKQTSFLKFAIAQKWIDHNPNGIINVLTIGDEIVSCFQRVPETPVDFWNTGSIVFDYVNKLVSDRKINSAKTKIASSNLVRDLFDARKSRGSNDLRNEYPISDELRVLCKAACIALHGAEMTRMDILKDNDGYLICEVNSPPGFVGHDIFLNKNSGDLIAKYAISKLNQFNEKF